MAAENIAHEGDIADDELRHRMQLLLLHQGAAIAIALHLVLAVIAFDAPAAGQALVMAAFQPAVGQLRIAAQRRFHIFDRQGLGLVEIAAGEQQAGGGFVALFIKLGNGADGFGKGHGTPHGLWD